MRPSTIPSYDFLSPRQILFGVGRWNETARLAATLGRRAFVVLGSRTLAARGFGDELARLLAEQGVESVPLDFRGHEPEVADVDRATRELRGHGIREGDLLVAVGGGSAIDLAKAVAAMATNTAGASVADYLEGVGRGLKISVPPLPMIAVPTTAGTGSEATKNAVISSYDPPFKKSLRSDLMMPRAVVIDPQLAVTLSPAVTAATGMDAMTQLIESYISRKRGPSPKHWQPTACGAPCGAIVAAVEDGGSLAARGAMAHAALLSGMALANSGLGMAHGVAAALGSHCRVTHGLACAVMLPVALRVNRQTSQAALAELARAAGVSDDRQEEAAADALMARVDEIVARIGIPRRLAALGVRRDQIPALVRDSRGNSMDGNPRQLSDDELATILEEQL